MRLLLLAALLSLPPVPAPAAPSSADGGDALHEPLTALLQRHVHGGRVDSEGLTRAAAALDA